MPGRAHRTARPRVGLALAGGGPLGGIYEVGALLALAESLDGVDLTELDVYVGVSSGGFVAAALANGISPTQMYRLFIDDGADAGLAPALFLRPAFGEFARRALSVPRLFGSAALDFTRQPFRRGALASFAALGRAQTYGNTDGLIKGCSTNTPSTPFSCGCSPPVAAATTFARSSASCFWSRRISTLGRP